MTAEWPTNTNLLLNQVFQWSQNKGWAIQREVISAALPNSSEDYERPALQIQTPQGRILFDPLGFRADGKQIVEMYAWPTLVRVRLVGDPQNHTWQVETDTGIPFYWEWNEENFTRLVRDLQVLP